MKITKVSLQGFRAFDGPFELDLAGGKNLLLHGENGSGKSSIYLALKRFFEERLDDIRNHRNQFSPARRKSYVHVHIKGNDASGIAYDKDFVWDDSDGHPLTVPKNGKAAKISPQERALLIDCAHRAGFLDYRAMLRTHLLSGPLPRTNWAPAFHNDIYGAETKELESQLFDLVSLVILAGVPVTIPGGAATTIGDLMRRVWEHRPPTWRQSDLTYSNNLANVFSQAFNAKLPELETKLAEFLNYFDNHQLSIKFRPVALAWDKVTKSLAGAKLVPEIMFRRKIVAEHNQFLNEARLSALATCLFLAGVHLSDNDFANPAYPRLLVLDDALIGLELQNRLPVLRILTSDAFKNYQAFLFTYDRVWFDLAKGHLSEKNGWLHRELIADESTGELIPHERPSQGDLQLAITHLANRDLKAAAVYIRSAFEWKLRKVCQNVGIKIPFNQDADTVGAGKLWDGVMERQNERAAEIAKGSTAPEFVSASLAREVETMRSTVLNKLSHTGSSSLVSAEVQAAIDTVKKVYDHTFPKKP